jgi:hypothetical protein
MSEQAIDETRREGTARHLFALPVRELHAFSPKLVLACNEAQILD